MELDLELVELDLELVELTPFWMGTFGGPLLFEFEFEFELLFEFELFGLELLEPSLLEFEFGVPLLLLSPLLPLGVLVGRGLVVVVVEVSVEERPH